jgi:GAF domain-containing protein
VQGDVGTVYRWDEGEQRLLPVATSSTGELMGMALALGESAVGQAAERRAPVLVSSPDGSGPGAAPSGTEIAVPLLHEGRLVGSLSVRTSRSGTAFGVEDIESLELLAGIAAAAEVGLERAQLVAVTLAARELAHLLNNDLAVPVGALELLCEDGSLPPRLRDIVEQGRIGLNDAAEHVFRLQQLVRFETKKTPIGPALDLDRSARGDARRHDPFPP